MLKIRVVAAEVFSRQVKSRATGKEYLFRDQMGVALIGSDSSPCKVSLSEDQAGYPVGVYEVLETSFYVDRDGKLALGRLALRPLQDAAGGAAASPAGSAAPVAPLQRKAG